MGSEDKNKRFTRRSTDGKTVMDWNAEEPQPIGEPKPIKKDVGEKFAKPRKSPTASKHRKPVEDNSFSLDEFLGLTDQHHTINQSTENLSTNTSQTHPMEMSKEEIIDLLKLLIKQYRVVSKFQIRIDKSTETLIQHAERIPQMKLEINLEAFGKHLNGFLSKFREEISKFHQDNDKSQQKMDRSLAEITNKLHRSNRAFAIIIAVLYTFFSLFTYSAMREADKWENSSKMWEKNYIELAGKENNSPE